jgi:cyclopropane fatty-acyl-phospholipid synthase-like methyltransferase
MNDIQPTYSPGTMDWDLIYREGLPPWETGVPAEELVRVLDEGLVPCGTALEIGCGTGANAVLLVKRGFEVTAVDSSATAIERARVRAEHESSLPRLLLADIFEFAQTCGQFDFVLDVGAYHFMRRSDLDRYLDALWRVTRSGSYYLTIAGAKGETAPGGPPQVSKRQIDFELGRLFETVQLRPCRLASPCRKDGYLAWSCLMQRPMPKK